jgi:hypothetical protein
MISQESRTWMPRRAPSQAVTVMIEKKYIIFGLHLKKSVVCVMKFGSGEECKGVLAVKN